MPDAERFRTQLHRSLRENWMWWLIPAAIVLGIIGASLLTANTTSQPPVFVYPTP